MKILPQLGSSELLQFLGLQYARLVGATVEHRGLHFSKKRTKLGIEAGDDSGCPSGVFSMRLCHYWSLSRESHLNRSELVGSQCGQRGFCRVSEGIIRSD